MADATAGVTTAGPGVAAVRAAASSAMSNVLLGGLGAAARCLRVSFLGFLDLVFRFFITELLATGARVVGDEGRYQFISALGSQVVANPLAIRGSKNRVNGFAEGQVP